jgi:uncharacterized protein YcbX
MGGEQVDELGLDSRGIVGDRLYAVYDTDGKLGSGKNSRRFRRMDGLLEFHARYDDGQPTLHAADGTPLRTPDGTALRGTGAQVDAALAVALGRPGVRLQREGAVPHHDAAGVHLVTTASLAWLHSLLPDASLTERRFRPNLFVEAVGTGRVEDGWAGRTLTIGTARLRVTRPTERCVMVNAPQPDLAADGRILKVLGAESDLLFGVYADVVEPGTVRIGDPAFLG